MSPELGTRGQQTGFLRVLTKNAAVQKDFDLINRMFVVPPAFSDCI
jgi:hypothetical protein